MAAFCAKETKYHIILWAYPAVILLNIDLHPDQLLQIDLVVLRGLINVSNTHRETTYATSVTIGRISHDA